MMRTDGDPPTELDYDMFLGPAPKRPYNPNRSIYHFRWFWDYSGGQATNLGQHSLDLVHWMLGVTAPKSVYSGGGRWFLKDNCDVPDTQDVIIEYPGFNVSCQYREATAGRGGLGMGGLTFFGTYGCLPISRGGFELSLDPKVNPNNVVAGILGVKGHPVGGPQLQPEERGQFWTTSEKDESGDAIQDYSRHTRNFLERWKRLKDSLIGPATDRRLPADKAKEFLALQREALLANPLLVFDTLLVVKRKPITPDYPFGDRLGNDGKPLWYSKGGGAEIGLPSNHECNSSLSRQGFDNEIAVMCPRSPVSPLRTVYRPADGGYVGEMDLHRDADRLLFTRSDAVHWTVQEMRTDGSGLRQVTRMPEDVDCYDACYLPDGSAVFRVPANTPLAVQPLDAGGRAVQLIRSWFTAMPGEVVSCIGCHETPADAAPGRFALAQQRTPHAIEPWQGAGRGFDFEREIQPVLDRYCVSCHGAGGAKPDLRPLADFPGYAGQPLDGDSYERMYPAMFNANNGQAKYTPAYDALVPYVRRVSIEDDVSLLVPAEYYAGNSELLQLLRKGHHGVRLDRESYDRLATWIDLNALCHGRWSDVYPIPEGHAPAPHGAAASDRRTRAGSGSDSCLGTRGVSTGSTSRTACSPVRASTTLAF